MATQLIQQAQASLNQALQALAQELAAVNARHEQALARVAVLEAEIKGLRAIEVKAESPNIPRDPVPQAPASHHCGAKDKQEGWRWCKNCHNMCLSMFGNGVCANGGGHDYSGSGKYRMPITHHGACAPQGNWRWCKKCQCLALGTGNTACATGGAHDFSSSNEYWVCLKGLHGQVGWAWCSQCGTLFYGAPGFVEKSKCNAAGPNGGPHNQRGSGSYQVCHD